MDAMQELDDRRLIFEPAGRMSAASSLVIAAFPRSRPAAGRS
jgi:hypothetical protein